MKVGFMVNFSLTISSSLSASHRFSCKVVFVVGGIRTFATFRAFTFPSNVPRYRSDP